jgi:hypothetical protein
MAMVAAQLICVLMLLLSILLDDSSLYGEGEHT